MKDWMRMSMAADGIELLQAWFAGVAFDSHRHDTYAIGVTDSGHQRSDYRGSTFTSTPGSVIVLHPDEAHDGRAGGPEGFGYHMVYVEPHRIGAAVRELYGTGQALPFVPGAVVRNPVLADAVRWAFHDPPRQPDSLAGDALVQALARGLVEASSARTARPARTLHRPALERAREFLDGAISRVVRSSELEAIAGLTRYELARQFRAAYGTSPYRYLLLRRLDTARRRIDGGEPLAGIAADLGFADQAHMTRLFRAAHGIPPARYRAMTRAAPFR